MEANDMKAMREALTNLVDVIERYASNSPLWWHDGAKGVTPLKNAKAALSAPPRQCDVGTAEEQERARNRETVADTVAEMRDAANSADAWRAGVAANVVMDFADRVETAARRERDHAVEHATRHAECVARDNCRDCVHNPRGKNYEGGNAAAMREALDYLCERMADMDATFDPSEVECLRAALAAPPRNCDVGTPEEQTRRMYSEYCRQHECYELPSGKHCPLYHEGIDCRFTWEQMPYKAEE